MGKYLLIAMTNPVPGREDEYNEWYENVALPVYRSIPGLTALGRFKSAGLPKSYEFEMDNPFEYVSLYTMETDDYAAFTAAAADHIKNSSTYYFSDAIDQTKFCEPVFIKI